MPEIILPGRFALPAGIGSVITRSKSMIIIGCRIPDFPTPGCKKNQDRFKKGQAIIWVARFLDRLLLQSGPFVLCGSKFVFNYATLHIICENIKTSTYRKTCF
jgi:hypothetical protein